MTNPNEISNTNTVSLLTCLTVGRSSCSSHSTKQLHEWTFDGHGSITKQS